MNDDGPQKDSKASSQSGLVDAILRRWKVAESERTGWLSLWQEQAQYVRPSRNPMLQASGGDIVPTVTGFEDLFDGTAIEANLILASGCMARLTPAQNPWFVFDPPRGANSDAIKRWYHECTAITLEALSTSNFYTEMHELYLDRGGFGTSLIHCEAGKNHPFEFRVQDVGTFALLNGSHRLADTVFRNLEFNASEAAAEYGEENLPESIRKELREAPDSSVKHKFLHIVYPREDADRDSRKMDGRNMPIASVHIYPKEKVVVRESGYLEMPSFGSRYLRWGNSNYGFCPAWQAIPDARQLNDLQRHLDVLAEVAAFPRLLAPSDHDGEIDLRSSGVTFFKDPQMIPREWATQGRYDIGQDRVAMRQEAIKRAFHVELFQGWSMISKQMTAAEVNARELEKIELFSPTFTLLTSELFGPMLRRIFALGLRQQIFPDPPQEALYINARGRWAIPDPEIRYTSRLALALKAVRSWSLDKAILRIGQMAGFAPSVADNLDYDRAWRDASMDDGLPVEWIADEDSVNKARQNRAEQQAQMAQMEQAKNMADSAAKLGQAGMLPQIQQPQTA